MEGEDLVPWGLGLCVLGVGLAIVGVGMYLICTCGCF